VYYALPVVPEKGTEIWNMGVPRQICISVWHVSVFQHCYFTVVGSVKYFCLWKVGSQVVGWISVHKSASVIAFERPLKQTNPRAVWFRWLLVLVSRWPPLTGAVAKLRKATVSFVMSGCPCIRAKQLGSCRTDIHKTLYLSIFRKICQENSSLINIW